MIINKTGNPVKTVSIVISMSMNSTGRMPYKKTRASQVTLEEEEFNTISLMELLACLLSDF